jgi:peptide/nickel transport system permease protein
MGRFFVHRLLIALLVSATVTVVGFGLLRMSGDLAAELAGEDATPEEIAQTAKSYGLDKPLYEQYLIWVSAAFKGDLGRSLFTNDPVTELISDRIGVTVQLALQSLALAILLAVPLGVIAARNPNSWIDRGALAFAVFGQAIPNFWFGLMLIVVFGVWLRWLPFIGSDTIVHFILPTVTLGVAVMPAIMRLTRTGMVEVLDSDFIRTARAKGLQRRAILYKHGLRYAILPVVSISAVMLGFLMGGSVIVESIFALNGVGFLAFQSILRADFPVVQSILVIISFLYIFLTLMSDLINAQLDPRIRLG